MPNRPTSVTRQLLSIALTALLVTTILPVSSAGAQDNEDPLGLARYAEIERRHTLGVDKIGVFRCEGAQNRTAKFYADSLTRMIGPWYRHHSRGRYTPSFLPRTEVLPADFLFCRNASGADEDVQAWRNRYPLLTSAVFVGPDLRTGALQQFLCTDDGSKQIVACPLLVNDPSLARWMTFNTGSFPPPGTPDYETFLDSHNFVHEVGHTLNWPHTFTGKVASPYDTLTDVMGGGGRSLRADETPPFAPVSGTNVFNEYRAGWIDPDEVSVVTGPGRTFRLHPNGAPDGRRRMIVIPDNRNDDEFWVLGARVAGNHDFIAPAWQGVEVYRVYADPEHHWPGNQRAVPLGDTPTKDIPWQGTFTEFSENDPLPHVLRPGQGAHVAGYTVVVTERVANRFTVEVTKGIHPLPPGSRFKDAAGSEFAAEINWLADAGITLGCNPPINTRFCPNDQVTRAQMASFLQRALDFPQGDPGRFADVPGTNPHRLDIAGLADAEVTRGCNPPANTRFCPGDPITRGQMAAFLYRALED